MQEPACDDRIREEDGRLEEHFISLFKELIKTRYINRPSSSNFAINQPETIQYNRPIMTRGETANTLAFPGLFALKVSI